MISDAVVKGQMENLDWTFFRRVIFFFFFFWGGRVVLFFLVCKKIAFSTFRQQAIFFHWGVGEGVEGGVVLYRHCSPLLFVGFVFYVRHF